MASRRVWKSAVARVLTRQQKNAPPPASLAARLLAMAQNNMSADEAAAMVAKRLLTDRGLDGGRSQPVNLTAICEAIGLAVKYQPLLADALLQETGSGYLAIINSAHKPSRQRLSLAHEIGHLMLYHSTGLRQAFGHLSPNERQDVESVEIEKLCDAFASELIMPSDDWRQRILNEGMSLTTLKKLMKGYGVSVAGAAQQVINVGECDCAVVVWSPVYESDRLIELKPVRWWEKLTPKGDGQPRKLRNSEEFRTPGSPFYALERRGETAGKLPYLFNNTRGRFLAHSDIIDAKYVATLIIPERLGWDMMFRNPQAKPTSVHS